MNLIKTSFLICVLFSFSSCLKTDKDAAGGLYSDKGSIVSTIAEAQYYHTDAQNVGFGYAYTVANFNFLNRPNESVKFFTVKVSQPRENKLTGNLVLKFSASAYVDNNVSGLGFSGAPTAVPTGAINIKDLVIPQSSEDLITVPVFFTVNKTLLNPDLTYGLRFTISSASQGVIGSLDKSVDVLINYSDFSANQNKSDFEANYTYNATVVDPANQVGINNNKTAYLIETATGSLEFMDLYIYGLLGVVNTGPFLIANNLITGARTSLIQPKYTINSSGVITAVTDGIANPAVGPITLDPTGENKFVYTSNTNRTLKVKYSFLYTTTINGVSTPRTVSVSESFSYDRTQVFF